MLNPYVDPLTTLMDWPRRGPGSAGSGSWVLSNPYGYPGPNPYISAPGAFLVAAERILLVLRACLFLDLALWEIISMGYMRDDVWTRSPPRGWPILSKRREGRKFGSACPAPITAFCFRWDVISVWWYIPFAMFHPSIVLASFLYVGISCW